MTVAVKPHRNGKPRKTAAKTAVAKIPQPNGGALYAGGVPGNAGGPGRAPSVIRERCRGSFETRIPILESIADGSPIQKVRMPGGEETEATISANPTDRIRAIEALGKFGLTAGRVDVEDVNGRLQRTIEIIADTLPAPWAEKLLALLDPVWRAA